MVTWREAVPSDDAARALLDQYFTARAQGFPAGPEAYRRTEPVDAEFIPPTGIFLIAEGENLSGEPADVGCGGIRRVADGALGSRFEFKHLWVLPHARRRGVGRALLDELAQRARGLGGAELVLDTHHSLDAAAALYAALGFAPIDPYNDNPNATTWLGRAL